MTEPRQHLSRFSPSKMSAETLDAIFVQRHQLLDDIAERLRESAQTKSRHHVLLIGPRGVGKTHLISLVFHRVEAMAREEPNLRVAWLLEDETSTSFLDLLARVWSALAAKYPDEFPLAVLDRARENPAKARKILEGALVDRLGGKTLVVLVENLDELFANLGRGGQHDFRAFLQESGALCLVATAQQFSADVSSRDSPFFGFFAVEHLMPLDEAGAVELLTRIARFQGDEGLAAFLGTSAGRDRVKVVLHLAGGNHRVFIILAEFLDRRTLDDLVGPFERLLDELTPYYQARIAWLAPQQRKIVEFLCRARQPASSAFTSAQPVPVGEIARALFMTNQSASSQLTELRRLGYVLRTPQGRESYYELAEPLMRLCWEVKEGRGEPIRLIVDFLRAWYTRDERQAMLATCEGPHARYRPYLEQALLEPMGAALGPSAPAIAGLSERMRDALEKGRELLEHGRFDEAIAAYSDVIEQRDAPPELVAKALTNRGVSHGMAGRVEEVLADWTRAIELPGAPPEPVARALVSRGVCHVEAGRVEEALADWTRVIELPGAPPDEVAMALFNRGPRHFAANRVEEELADYTRVIELPGAPPEPVARALVNRGVSHDAAGRVEEALADWTRAIELPGAPPEPVARALVSRGVSHVEAGRVEEALADWTRAIELPGPPPGLVAMALFNRGVLHVAAGRVEEALADWTRAIELPGAPPEEVAMALVNRGFRHFAAGREEEGLADWTRVIELPGAPTVWVALAASSRGWIELLNGEVDRARDDIMKALSIKPDLDTAVFNAALVKVAGGDWEGGLADFDGAIERFPGLAEGNVDDPAFLWVRLLESGGSAAIRARRAAGLVEVYDRRSLPLSILGSALVRSLRWIQPSRVAGEVADEWVGVLEGLARKREALIVPVRLYRVGLRYRLTEDRGVFLELPLEERRVLLDLFGLPDAPESTKPARRSSRRRR